MVFQGKAYNEIRIGEHISAALTITETHLVLAAALTGDFNPLHINQQFAEKSQFGSRILHGVATSAIMGGLPGMYFAGTAVAYLEHNCRFKAPVRPGDTLTTVWTISRKSLTSPIITAASSCLPVCAATRRERWWRRRMEKCW